jgi:hypothetical protein
MSIIPRETLYGALFTQILALLAPGATPAAPGVDAVPGVPTADKPFNMVSREVIEVQRVPPALQPVLFMDEAIEEYTRDGNGLYHKRCTVYFHVGCTSTKGTPACSILNPLIDVLEALLYPTDGPILGLDDRVVTGQVAGMSVKNLGDNSTSPSHRQAVAYVPFEIVFA